MLYFLVELNVARNGAEPVWRELVDDNGETRTWTRREEAEAVLASEGRGENGRLMRVINGIARPV